MAKKRWPFLVGLSLITGLVSSSWLRKKDDQLAKKELDELVSNYQGSWWFINTNRRVQHRLDIDDQLNLYLDGQRLKASLQELTKNKLVFQDQYGYHIAVHCEKQSPSELYDEADDCVYSLQPAES